MLNNQICTCGGDTSDTEGSDAGYSGSCCAASGDEYQCNIGRGNNCHSVGDPNYQMNFQPQQQYWGAHNSAYQVPQKLASFSQNMDNGQNRPFQMNQPVIPQQRPTPQELHISQFRMAAGGQNDNSPPNCSCRVRPSPLGAVRGASSQQRQSFQMNNGPPSPAEFRMTQTPTSQMVPKSLSGPPGRGYEKSLSQINPGERQSYLQRLNPTNQQSMDPNVYDSNPQMSVRRNTPLALDILKLQPTRGSQMGGVSPTSQRLSQPSGSNQPQAMPQPAFGNRNMMETGAESGTFDPNQQQITPCCIVKKPSPVQKICSQTQESNLAQSNEANCSCGDNSRPLLQQNLDSGCCPQQSPTASDGCPSCGEFESETQNYQLPESGYDCDNNANEEVPADPCDSKVQSDSENDKKGFWQQIQFQICQQMGGNGNNNNCEEETNAPAPTNTAGEGDCCGATENKCNGDSEPAMANSQEGNENKSNGKSWQQLTLDIYQTQDGAAANNGGESNENQSQKGWQQQFRLCIYQEKSDNGNGVITKTNFNNGIDNNSPLEETNAAAAPNDCGCAN